MKSKLISLNLVILLLITVVFSNGCRKDPVLATLSLGDITVVDDYGFSANANITEDGNSDIIRIL